MSVPNSGEEILRLAAVIDRQRRELDRLRSAAAARSVIDMAKGALIERLGCTAAEAASQLTALADEAGYPVAEIAAAIISEDLAGQPGEPADPGLPGAGTGSADAGPGADGEAARPEDARLRNQLAGAAIELAADGGEIAAAVLDQALAPLGAAAVALWLISADGSLDLLGEAGLGPAEASRWRRIPPHMDCPAQRVAHGGPDLWWPSGPPGDTPPDATRPSGPPSSLPGSNLPLIGRWPGGARATVALRDESSVLLGVMEVCWPQPRAGFPHSVRQQAADLAQACAELLGPRLARGDLANAGSRPAVRGLLDSCWRRCWSRPRCGTATAASWTSASTTPGKPCRTRPVGTPARWPAAPCWRPTPPPRRPAACWSTRSVRCKPARPNICPAPSSAPRRVR